MGLEGLEEVGEEAAGGEDGGFGGLGRQAAHREEEQGDVGGGEVLAELAGVAGALDEVRQALLGAGPLPVVVQGFGEAGHEVRFEAAVGDECGADLFQERVQAVARVRVGHGLLERGRAHGQLVLEGGGDECRAGGEAAVEGGHADTGPAGDRADRGVHAVGREDLARGVQDAFPVAAGVGAQLRRSFSGRRTGRLVRGLVRHASHFRSKWRVSSTYHPSVGAAADAGLASVLPERDTDRET
ncbi:hypothetical protein RKD29_004207 [Streptomyces tendae]